MFQQSQVFPEYESDSLYELAQVALVKDDKQKAILHLQRAVEVKPSYASLYQLGTLILNDAKDPKQAI
jgi:hypothetical protein